VGRAAVLFEQLVELNPGNSELAKGLLRARGKWNEQSLPPEYRQAMVLEEIDRGDLSALVAVGMGWNESEEVPGKREVAVIVDIGDHWAQSYIRDTVCQGVMQVFQNHTFRPELHITRGDLARLACGLLERANTGDSPGKSSSPSKRAISDLPREHLQYHCACRLVELGVMQLYLDNTFRINQPVSGPEALRVITAARSASVSDGYRW